MDRSVKVGMTVAFVLVVFMAVWIATAVACFSVLAWTTCPA